MTKEFYETKRKQLFEKFDSLLDQEKVEDAKNVMNEIDQLDQKWNDITEARANFQALYGATGRLAPWGTGKTDIGTHDGEAVDRVMLDGYGYGIMTKGQQDNQIATAGNVMTDQCIKRHPEQLHLLSMQNALGDCIRGMVTGNWSNMELKNAITTTSTGTLIPQVLSSQVIDLARNISLFGQSGVPTVAMESDNITISRLKTDPTFAFKAEAAEATESSFEMDAVKLQAKTCYGYAYISIEAIKSSRNLDAVIRNAFAAAMANCIDLAFLYGQKDTDGNYSDAAPDGIMNDENILTVEGATDVSYDDFLKAAAAIRNKNGIPTAWAIPSATDAALGMLKDLQGNYLEIPSQLAGMKKVVSNQLSDTDGIVFAPDSMLIGIQEGLTIKTIEDGECLKKGLIGFQIYSMQDCKIIRPQGICKITAGA